MAPIFLSMFIIRVSNRERVRESLFQLHQAGTKAYGAMACCGKIETQQEKSECQWCAYTKKTKSEELL